MIYYHSVLLHSSYKVIFSMSLLGDPKLLAHQYKAGITDLVLKSRKSILTNTEPDGFVFRHFSCLADFSTIFEIKGDEVLSGGKDGVGKGATSFLQNVIGGTFFAVGKVTGM